MFASQAVGLCPFDFVPLRLNLLPGVSIVTKTPIRPIRLVEHPSPTMLLDEFPEGIGKSQPLLVRNGLQIVVDIPVDSDCRAVRYEPNLLF